MDSSIRVLHVDDSPDFLDVSVPFLEQTDERFTVTTATSTGEELDRLDDNIDCIVSDCESLFKAGSLATGRPPGSDSQSSRRPSRPTTGR